jgi:uncharacterized short protein YbdD (DUF466 family)
MRNRLFGLPGRILCEQLPCCKKKTLMSMLLTFLFTYLAFLGLPWNDHPIQTPCTAHAFFPECLRNRCQGLCRTFSDICTKFDAGPLSVSSWNSTRADTRFQVEGRRKSTSSPSCLNFFYPDSQDMLVLSSNIALLTYNCCTDSSTSHEKYEYPS